MTSRVQDYTHFIPSNEDKRVYVAPQARGIAEGMAEVTEHIIGVAKGEEFMSAQADRFMDKALHRAGADRGRAEKTRINERFIGFAIQDETPLDRIIKGEATFKEEERTAHLTSPPARDHQAVMNRGRSPNPAGGWSLATGTYAITQHSAAEAGAREHNQGPDPVGKSQESLG